METGPKVGIEIEAREHALGGQQPGGEEAGLCWRGPLP